MTDMPSEAELQAREERVRANAAASPASPEGPDEELRERVVALPDEAHRFIDGEWWVRSTDVRAALSRTAERERRECVCVEILGATTAQRDEARERADRLARVGQARLAHGHNDTCDVAIDKAAGPPFQGYACTCGHDDLRAALSDPEATP